MVHITRISNIKNRLNFILIVLPVTKTKENRTVTLYEKNRVKIRVKKKRDSDLILKKNLFFSVKVI